MSLIFADGFDNYTNIPDVWDSNGDSSIRRTGVARTGPGCLEINSGAIGPAKIIRQVTDCLVATAWYSSITGNVLSLGNEGASSLQGACVILVCNPDGSLNVERGPSHGPQLIATSAPGLVTFNAYNSLAMQSQVSATATVKVWCNGVLVLNLTGIDTRNLHNPGRTYIDAFTLWGPPASGFICFHDDVYVLDCTDAVNNTYLNALRMYALPPTANAAVAWTPLAGTNWSEVNEVPPDGDTSYNSSSNVGDLDQYVYPLTGPPANSSILFVQHELDMEVDSGSRSVGSVANGTAVQGVIALPNGYHIYPTPYDINPATGLPWKAADFPSNFGPQVTA